MIKIKQKSLHFILTRAIHIIPVILSGIKINNPENISTILTSVISIGIKDKQFDNMDIIHLLY
ncbi:hypothetical protein L1994_11005 [Methanomicrobium antiquum]|uniref:Uncharacterized protein n=1 Tax=Methanomicrobium antiquum TaxID=487686 RepID=A0AAF0JML1_9EURY|nr:hypothetical protein [Methanomicrobium antiquum]WFN36655.1 hypothetical protein L1994_11005 [Methanomicrobium antiquum]